MGLGSPGVAPPPRRASERREFPIVFAVAFAFLLAVDIPALRDLDQTWTIAAGGGIAGAFVGAAFAYGFFGVGGDLSYYGWKRGLFLSVVTAIFTGLTYLIFRLPFLPTFAIGLLATLFALMLLLKATGDL